MPVLLKVVRWKFNNVLQFVLNNLQSYKFIESSILPSGSLNRAKVNMPFWIFPTCVYQHKPAGLVSR